MKPSPNQNTSATDLGLKDAQLEEILDFAKKYPKIEQVIVYGSRAKGSYRPGSDVDLVLVGKDLKLSDQLAFWNDLDDSYQPYFFLTWPSYIIFKMSRSLTTFTKSES